MNNPTLRDQLAMAGLQAVVTQGLCQGKLGNSREIAEAAYHLADAMLAARGTPEPISGLCTSGNPTPEQADVAKKIIKEQDDAN